MIFDILSKLWPNAALDPVLGRAEDEEADAEEKGLTNDVLERGLQRPGYLGGVQPHQLSLKYIVLDINICFYDGPSKHIYQYGSPRSVDCGHDHGYPGAQEYHAAEDKRVLRISADTV